MKKRIVWKILFILSIQIFLRLLNEQLHAMQLRKIKKKRGYRNYFDMWLIRPMMTSAYYESEAIFFHLISAEEKSLLLRA